MATAPKFAYMSPAEFRREMKSAKFTYNTLGQLVGVVNNSISRWSRGLVPIPAYVKLLFTVIRACNVRGIDWRELMPEHHGNEAYEEHRKKLADNRKKRAKGKPRMAAKKKK